MNRSELIEFLNRAEDRYPVDHWKINDIHIWPIVKTSIFYHWYNRVNHTKSERKKGKIEKLIQVPISTFRFILFCLKCKKRTKKPIFLSGSQYHRVNFQGEFINRYYQPIVEWAEKKNLKFISADYSLLDRNKKYNSIEEPISLEQLFIGAKVFYKLKKARRKNELEIKSLESFINECIDLDICQTEYNKYLDLIIEKTDNVLAISYIFKLIFLKYSPDIAIGLCYYNLPMFAMNYAANKLGVKSIDLQHGGQGKQHIAYTYLKIPPEGYNLLPQIFWCWDDASKNDISSWTSLSKAHKVIQGGNPWLEYLTVENKKNRETNGKRIILYTMQLDSIEDFIVDAIRNTPEEYEWWLRLHPRKLSMRDNIEKKMVEEGLSHKVEIDKAISQPLPQILLSSYIHLSRYSGSIIEAAQLGVPNIILDKTGAEIYKDYVQNGKAIVLASQKGIDLVNLIVHPYENKKSTDEQLIGELNRTMSNNFNFFW